MLAGIAFNVSDTESPAAATQPDAEPTECCGGGDEGHGCSMLPVDGQLRPGPLDGCPTPLAWRQVLESFRQESTPWEITRGSTVLRGRSWGHGPPLYLVCGMGGTSDSFSLVNYLLRDLFRCVTFDWPGTREPVASNSVTLDSLSDDLLTVADYHGDGQFSLFATSFGSLIALRAMHKAPDRITRAVIQGGFAYRKLSLAERAIAALGRVLPGRLRSMPGAKQIHQQNHRTWFPTLDPSRWQFFLDDAAGVPIRTLGQRGAIIRDTDLRAELPKILQPTLLIQCEGDGLVSRECHETMAQGLPNSQTAWMHSAGHLPHLTSPHRLAKFLRDFLLTATQCPEAAIEAH